MPGGNRSTRYHITSTLWITLIGFLSSLIFCGECWSNGGFFLRVGTFMAVLWVVMWKGNEVVSDYADQWITWDQEPRKRLIAGIVGHLVYSVVAITALNYAVYLLFGWNENAITLDGIIEYSVTAVAITFFISSVVTAKEFFVVWRQAAVNEEQMKRELITAKFEALKNQVNPHFLFNSLNVLTSLVYKDADLSARYIKQLSTVYRYVLDVQDKELVDLRSELDFLRSYVFLLKMRHDQGLEVNIGIENGAQCEVAPLALQMLVENAVKHNVVSVEEPLAINIQMENGYVVVSNNLQRKNQHTSGQTKVGLANIKARYAFFTPIPVIVDEAGGSFTVKLPVLKLEA